MSIDIKAVNNQADFCKELMQRLYDDIKSSEPGDSYYGVERYTQKKADIIRLRRELQTLNSMLDPYKK